jgi:YHS domain-containing protein
MRAMFNERRSTMKMFAQCIVAAALVASVESQAKNFVNVDRHGVALQGYDPVAYFIDGKPVKGKKEFYRQQDGGTYHFASAEHKKRFDDNPEMYAPQFGGYCAYAASINRVSPISPEFWEIRDGRLLLQHNQRATDLWNQDPVGHLAKADANWPGLVEKNGAEGTLLVLTDNKGVALEGYDPVTYFTDAKPRKGDAKQEAVYKGAKYHFVSAESRATFEQNPSMYEPAYGGYCGYAASINRVSPVNPLIYQMENGRLILQHTQEAYDLFNKDLAGNIVKADANWPGLVARNGSAGGKRQLTIWGRLFGWLI